MWLGIIWNLLKGNLAGIVTSITSYMGKLSDNETTKLTTAIGADKEVAVAQLQANANVYHDRKDLLKGMGITQWLIAAALIPPIAHMGMVYGDSMPFPYIWIEGWFPVLKMHVMNTWHVVKPPAPYDTYEWSLVGSLLGIQTTATVGLGIAKALIRR